MCHDLPITLQVENAELLGMDNGRSDDRILWKNAAQETWRVLAFKALMGKITGTDIEKLLKEHNVI